MGSKEGVWALWVRGSRPLPWTKWREAAPEEVYGEGHNEPENGTNTLEYGVACIAAFLEWKKQGQHVRLEWMPNNAYGQKLERGDDGNK